MGLGFLSRGVGPQATQIFSPDSLKVLQPSKLPRRATMHPERTS
jgi:hypothetical protein